MKYPCDITYLREGEDVYWVVKSKVLEHCVAQGDTPEEALMIFDELEQAWLDACELDNLDIPELVPVEEPSYSGKISLRMSKSTHELAARTAEEQGISLNQYINESVIARNVNANTVDLLFKLNTKNKVKKAFDIFQRNGDSCFETSFNYEINPPVSVINSKMNVKNPHRYIGPVESSVEKTAGN